MAQLYLLAVTLNVWVLVAVLAAAFGVQLWFGEAPCPLCVMQRTALMLVGLGPLHILLRENNGLLTARVAAVGQGMAIVAASLGAIAAGWLTDSKVSWPLTRITAIAFAAIVIANLLSVIAEAGLHWELPENPV